MNRRGLLRRGARRLRAAGEVRMYFGASTGSETTTSAASSGATGNMPLRPNLVWSATMMSRSATSIIFFSDPTTRVLLLLSPCSVIHQFP